MHFAKLGLAIVMAALICVIGVAVLVMFGLIGLSVIESDPIQFLITWMARIGFTVGVAYGFFDSIARALAGRCQPWSPLAWGAAVVGLIIFWVTLFTVEPPSPYAMEERIERYQAVQTIIFCLLVGGFFGGVMGSSRPPSLSPYPDEDLA